MSGSEHENNLLLARTGTDWKDVPILRLQEADIGECIAGTAAAGVTGERAAEAKAASMEAISSSLMISTGILEDVPAILVADPASFRIGVGVSYYVCTSSYIEG